jgi:hypothetical protein
MASVNPLEEFPNIRKWVYRVYWIVGVIVTAIQIGFVAATGSSPLWAGVTIAVLAYIGFALGFQADVNTPKRPSPPAIVPAPPPDND